MKALAICVSLVMCMVLFTGCAVPSETQSSTSQTSTPDKSPDPILVTPPKITVETSKLFEDIYIPLVWHSVFPTMDNVIPFLQRSNYKFKDISTDETTSFEIFSNNANDKDSIIIYFMERSYGLDTLYQITYYHFTENDLLCIDYLNDSDSGSFKYDQLSVGIRRSEVSTINEQAEYLFGK